jgi:hypothetical protein
LKVKVVAWNVNREEMTEFLNSNKIIELDIDHLNDELMVDDSFYGSLKSLKIHDAHLFIDLKKFTSL